MRTSIPGTRSSAGPAGPGLRSSERRAGVRRARSEGGFTLVELAVVFFIMGLVLWLAAPRLATVVEPDRSAVFRELSSSSEKAFDLSLFEKREVRLVLDPAGAAYRFQVMDNAVEPPPARALGDRLAITGIRIDDNDRPLDIVTEIRYLPGGRLPDARIFLRDSGAAGDPTDWTLRLSPVDGSLDVIEGRVLNDA